MNGDTITVSYDLSQAQTLKNPLELFRNIRNFIFDVDGVLTDGKLMVTESGDCLRTFHCRDGYAIRRAIEEGYNFCVITGGRGGSIEKRLKMLGIPHFFTGAEVKLPIFKRYCATHNINPMETLYMGDDLNDYEVMQKVALPCCPANACEEIKNICHYISPLSGGDGCARDVIEKVMKLHGRWLSNISVSG